MNVINQEKYEIAYVRHNAPMVIDLLNIIFEEDQTFSSLSRKPMTRDEIIESLTNLLDVDKKSFTLDQLVKCRKVLTELFVIAWDHRDILINKCYSLLPKEDETFYVSNFQFDNKLLEDIIDNSKSLTDYIMAYKVLSFHKKIMGDL